MIQPFYVYDIAVVEHPAAIRAFGEIQRNLPQTFRVCEHLLSGTEIGQRAVYRTSVIEKNLVKHS